MKAPAKNGRSDKHLRIFFLAFICFVLWANSARRAPLPGVELQPLTAGQHPPFVTFIIPSIARKSLHDTLKSIYFQTDPNWRAVVVFDGIQTHSSRGIPLFLLLSSILTDDPRITFVNLPVKSGVKDCAGHLRNVALAYATTPWVAFVDDDDTVDHKYVELLRQEVEISEPEVVIFRMFNRRLKPQVLPQPDARDLRMNSVGISFAVNHAKVGKDLWFSTSTAEDYDLLHKLCHLQRRSCVLSPHVTYYVHGDFDADIFPEQGLRTYVPRNGDYLPNENLYMARFACSYPRRHQSRARFMFTEEDDLFFGNNVKALKASLSKAIELGCLDDYDSRHPIHIIFKAATRPMSPVYIQIQLEQHSSSFFSPKYMSKLSMAAQIWEFSPSNARLMQAKAAAPGQFRNVYYMPTMQLVDPENPAIRCPVERKPTGAAPRAAYEVYRDGCYIKCANERTVSARPSKCPIEPNDCSLVDKNTCSSVVNEAEVVMYGALECSDGQRREAVCDDLSEAGISVACLQGIFGEALDEFVCKSKVIVVDHFYPNATLETHRIDALLLAGKIVVAVPSADPAIDAQYSDFVIFSERENIVATVQQILSNWRKWSSMSRARSEQLLQQVQSRDAMCYALRSLKADVMDGEARRNFDTNFGDI